MKIRPARTGALLLGALYVSAFVGCGEARQPEPAEVVAEAPASGPGSAEQLQARCANCHDHPHSSDPDNSDPGHRRAPGMDALARLTAAHIAFTLTNGTMKPHAEGLRTDQIYELAQFISDAGEPWSPTPDLFCADRTINPEPVSARWGVDAANTAALPDGTSSIFSSNVAQLELAWAFGLPNVSNARSRPVLTANTLFVAAASGHLFALDRAQGCIRWHTIPPAPPRTALTLGRTEQGGQARSTLFYGDMEAHMNAVDALSGESLWRIDATVSEHTMLTGAPVQHEDRLIVPVSLYEVSLALDPAYECCKSHGAVLALDANSGAQRWLTEMTPAATPRERSSAGTRNWGPSGVPVWSTPTIDAQRGLIYVGTGQNASLPATELSDAVVALELDSGAIAWHFQAIAGDAYNMACDQRPPGPNCPKWRGPDHDIGAAVVLTETATGDDVLLVGQKSGDVYALDPDASGRLLWRERVGAGSALGGVHWGLASAAGKLFVPISDPPYPLPGYRPKPGLYALSVDDGHELWASPLAPPCQTNLYEYFGRDALYPECSFFYGLSAPPLAVNDLVFAAGLDGRLHAHSADDGARIWQFDTATTFDAVNGIATHGGAIDVAGVQVADDMLFVMSGYSLFGQLPGNALLAFRLSDSH